MKQTENTLRYEAQVIYNDRAVALLAKVQTKLSMYKVQAFSTLMAAVLLSYGLFLAENQVIGIVFAGSGCLLYVFLQYPQRQQINLFRSSFGQVQPVVRYEFHDHCFLSHGIGEQWADYPQIQMLLKHRSYYILVTDRGQALMLDSSSLSSGGFCEFMQEKTGLRWKNWADAFWGKSLFSKTPAQTR